MKTIPIQPDGLSNEALLRQAKVKDTESRTSQN